MSYMGGANAGDDRRLYGLLWRTRSAMYLANWYMTELFGEKKLLNAIAHSFSRGLGDA